MLILKEFAVLAGAALVVRGVLDGWDRLRSFAPLPHRAGAGRMTNRGGLRRRTRDYLLSQFGSRRRK